MDAPISTDDTGNPTSEPAREVAQAPTTEAAAPATAAPAPVEDGALTIEQHDAAIATVMPEGDRDRLAAQIIGAGGIDHVHMNLNQGNLEPEQFRAHVAGVQAGLQSMADQYVAAQGVDQQAFYDYVRAKGSGVMNSTGLLMFHGRNPEMALAPLLAEFKRTAAGRRR